MAIRRNCAGSGSAGNLQTVIVPADSGKCFSRFERLPSAWISAGGGPVTRGLRAWGTESCPNPEGFRGRFPPQINSRPTNIWQSNLHDPATAEHSRALIDDSRLPRGHRQLRFVEPNLESFGIFRIDRDRRRFRLPVVANLHGDMLR